MATVTLVVKAGKSLWGGIDNAHPSAAYLVGAAGAEIEVDDGSQAYAEYHATGKCAVSGITAPGADFSANVLTGAAPLTVQFANESVNSTSWAWTFGDAGTSTSENPSHQYTDPGTYTVTLTATNTGIGDFELEELSDIRTRTAYITVTA